MIDQQELQGPLHVFDLYRGRRRPLRVRRKQHRVSLTPGPIRRRQRSEHIKDIIGAIASLMIVGALGWLFGSVAVGSIK